MIIPGGPRSLPLVTAILALVLFGCSSTPTASSPAPASQPAATPAAQPAAAPAATPAPAAAPPAALQSQDANQAGVVGDLTECKRADGVLTVKVRFRNSTDKPFTLHVIDSRNYEKFYVTAASKKYFILKDSEGTYLTPNASNFGNLDVSLAPSQGWLWWAKYPAPPADVTKITLITPITPPYEDVPISDK